MAFSPDGDQLAVGDVAGNVRVWPQRTLRRESEGP
ncbi:WD40 repeat domain-containing protein [Streptomyces sanglieri]|uniref:WD40 repeat domain-containing protein n=1 Tax=Streptomyces sanglieri TaxID=193460 RepID=A0ABW2WM39_9ACTN